MSLKTVLVHVDDTASCKVRFDLALQLALSHDAHLVGLYVGRIYALEWNALTIENVRTYEDGEGERLRDTLQEHSRRAGKNLEWRSIKVKNEVEIGLHARYADLVIIGQPGPKDRLYTSPDFPAALTLAVARPVLVIPHDYESHSVGRSILLAWNRSREATRAVSDALPLFKKAQKVTVLVVKDDEGTLAGGEEPGADIALYLARHGVNVELRYDRAQDDDRTVAGGILSHAAEISADLIVMGAYGHWRLHELLVGGVTRSMIRNMNVPILMSH